MQEETENTKLPRENWEEAFKRMYENGDNELLIDDIFEDLDLEEWENSHK